MLCAIDLTAGASDAAGRVRLASVTTVYLRINPATTLEVDARTLPIGFRITIAEVAEDIEELLGILDRALVRARRHAAILAGDSLDAQLEQLDRHHVRAWPGIRSTISSWPDRRTKARGLARLIDINDCNGAHAASAGIQPMTSRGVEDGALADLHRCLVIALTAGWISRRLRWQDDFAVSDAVRQAGWDVLAPSGHQ